MFRYFKKINKDNNESTLPLSSNLRNITTICLPHGARSTAQNIAPPISTAQSIAPPVSTPQNESSIENSVNEDLLASLPSDPGLRPPIFYYDPNIRDQVRRAYLERGPCQAKKTCLSDINTRPSSGDSFVGKGFRNWRKKTRLHDHIGKRNNAHNIALKKCVALLNRKQHINSVIFKQSEETKREYMKRAVVLDNAPGNQKLITPDIQKDITRCFSSEILSQIVKEIGDGPFSILLDESKEISSKEQLAIVLRYVHKGQAIERFLGIEHVTSTTAVSLKATVDDFFSRHGLSISRLRGQGYDGESNIKASCCGCFKKHTYVEHLYVIISNLVNVVAGSAKRQDMLRSKQADAVFEALCSGEIVSGWGFNQESTLKRAGDTSWVSHHNTIVSLINIFSSVVTLLEDLAVDSDKKFESKRKDQDIVNAMKLLTVCKERLQLVRDDDWDSMLSEVSFFCTRHRIKIPDMNDVFQREGRPRRNVEEVTYSYHYRVEYFNTVIDMQLLELNNRFNETNTELLLSVVCLSPIDSFFAFDKEKLIRFSRFYPRDFSPTQLVLLEDQLLSYIADVRSSNEFLDLKGIADLAVKMVETKKDIVYPLV
ncbi:uncharacterized protein LOC113340348 [Papaver somniferum]|uniref:uncharacterized protein LOC113340348 n=1 Tax=Papaver somniferum TaxID=3469 RepID=UPI000E70208D|nr:uncharacterized protein LOC113340348 [Papaver somniferum]